MDGAAFGWLSFVTVLTAVVVIFLYVKVVHMQRHVFLLLRHHNIDPTKPPQLSDRVKELARNPATKIEAIKVLREETGAGLAEAKWAVETYTHSLPK
jgi:ribosomal protein L7/L12